jgi:glycosyltransferase involved in cell wall biosynthesis
MIDYQARNRNTVSILIPSYNQCKYLQRNLDILRQQMVSGIELLVADGGSIDGSAECLRLNHDIITWFVSERDYGQSDALNKALARATGFWIGWQNSDDCYTADALQRFREIIEADERAGKIADVYFAHANVIDLNDRVVFRKFYGPFNLDDLKYLGYNCTNQSMFIRRELLISVGGWDPRFHFAMDADLWFRLKRAGARFRLVDEVWGSFRIQPDSKSSLMTTRKTDEWLLLGEREFPQTANLHIYSGRLHWRKFLRMVLRHYNLIRIGRWSEWLRYKIEHSQ